MTTIEFGMGGMGGMGLVGSADGRVGFLQPDSLEIGEVPYYGVGYAKDTKPKMSLIKDIAFDDRCWDAQHLAQAVLGEFAAFRWQSDPDIDPGPWTKIDIDEEIRALIALGTLARPRRYDEILAQANDATPFWANLLMASPVACPATWTLIQIAEAIGMMVSMYFKRIYQRPRPVQVYPGLMPLLLTPAHASYPNAHALQSYLMSGLIAQEKVRPDLKDPLEALAMRVAHNREVAGVHYPSDRIASKRMAEGILKTLDKLRKEKTSAYAAITERASFEWGDILRIPQQGTAYPRPA